jgi:tRNA(fMet)-specific endonuclease VapC|tara:strand:+ start:5659 stop:6069 length:411 start_codon:yes stop_codon:yes gene_type:complete
MGVVIDSNIFIDIERGLIDADSYLSNLDNNANIYISVITVSELLHGVYRAINQNQKLRRSAFVEKIITNIPALPIDTQIARSHAELNSYLIKKGKKIGLHDSWIAATCISLGYDLSTKDMKAFEQIPGLSLIKGIE